MRRNAITLFASALLLAWAHRAFAQTPCEDALREAEKSYELGLFEDVPGKLSPCLGQPTSRSAAIQVHSLLAQSYLNNEEPEQARKEISTLLRLQSNYEAEAGSSPRFVALVAQVRREESTTQVVSVSKTSESLREAPATVLVLTADEIRRRGYIDFEEILHDLPGFDISLLNGSDYSLVYQRGFNSPQNDRLLLLIDGVEQNDLTFGTPYLSRQYSLSNIDRVEVIYGPASTMYGANAYTGLMNIITREPESIVGDKNRLGIAGQTALGGYGTRSVDVTAAGTDSAGVVAWSLTTNFQKSSARNLAHLDNWDYTYRNFDYKTLMHLSGLPEERAVLCAQPSPYIQCSAAGIDLTDKGVDLVRGLDSRVIRDNGAGFKERAENWSVYGKVRISNLTLGLQSWSSQESIASGTSAVIAAGNTFWTPRNTSLYLKYSLPLDALKLNVFMRYVQTSLDRSASTYDFPHNYASGYLNLLSLVPPCQSPGDPVPVSCAPASPWIERVTFGALSSQIRTEASLLYERSAKWNAVAGVEFTKSTIQSQFDQTATGPGYISSVGFGSPQQNEHTDTALYAQGSYRMKRSLRFVVAGRISYNQINDRAGVKGYGALFTPRLGVIYSPAGGRLVLKSIYSEAFKDAVDQEKFGVLAHTLAYPSNGLRPERVRNAEVSANWSPDDRLALDASLYEAHYAGIVNVGYPQLPDGSLVPDCQFYCLQYQNRDTIHVRGLQATGRYKLSHAQLWGNYTHTDPLQVKPLDFFGNSLVDAQGNPVRQVRVADIASNQFNIGVETIGDGPFRAGFRFHYVGPRRTGVGTSNSFSPFTQMDAHSTVNATLSYRTRLPGVTLQLVGNNLLNKDYYDGGTIYSTARVLQAGRTVYLRLFYRTRQQ